MLRISERLSEIGNRLWVAVLNEHWLIGFVLPCCKLNAITIGKLGKTSEGKLFLPNVQGKKWLLTF